MPSFFSFFSNKSHTSNLTVYYNHKSNLENREKLHEVLNYDHNKHRAQNFFCPKYLTQCPEMILNKVEKNFQQDLNRIKEFS